MASEATVSSFMLGALNACAAELFGRDLDDLEKQAIEQVFGPRYDDDGNEKPLQPQSLERLAKLIGDGLQIAKASNKRKRLRSLRDDAALEILPMLAAKQDIPADECAPLLAKQARIIADALIQELDAHPFHEAERIALLEQFAEDLVTECGTRSAFASEIAFVLAALERDIIDDEKAFRQAQSTSPHTARALADLKEIRASREKQAKIEALEQDERDAIENARAAAAAEERRIEAAKKAAADPLAAPVMDPALRERFAPDAKKSEDVSGREGPNADGAHTVPPHETEPAPPHEETTPAPSSLRLSLSDTEIEIS